MDPGERAEGKAPSFRIRAGGPADAETMLRFVRELAALEGRPEAVSASAADLHAALFGETAVAESLVVELDGSPVGLALFYPVFSTFQAKAGLYLEDLYLVAHARGHGLGRACMAHLAHLARARGWSYLQWSVVAENHAAIAFYEGLGAQRLVGTHGYRLTGSSFSALASS
jgi:GNAT superfamily N-acetyltransferase